MTIKEINEFCKNSFIEFMSIKFTGFNNDIIEASMPIDKHKLQPMGVMHGGVSLVLAETVASAGSFLMIDHENKNVFGMQVSGNHVSTISSGSLHAKGTLNHKGRSTHVWNIEITNEVGKLISVVRVTNSIQDK